MFNDLVDVVYRRKDDEKSWAISRYQGAKDWTVLRLTTFCTAAVATATL
jgi:hypothetical protein